MDCGKSKDSWDLESASACVVNVYIHLDNSSSNQQYDMMKWNEAESGEVQTGY